MTSAATTARHRILVVDDEPEMAKVVEQALARRGYDAQQEHSADAAWERLEKEDFDIVVTDLNMRGMNGVELTERIVKNRHDVPVIVITAFGSLETAIATLRAGAYDFITKPFEIDQLVVAVERALSNRRLREEVKRLREEVERSKPGAEFVGDSPAMRKVHETLARVAETDATTLITGESGTGKELVARDLHRRSKRADGPFIAINCAALPEALLESELFGHAKGAFTDAKAPKKGLFVEASNGTLFLDEIGEMPPGMQAKLLRALEERTVRQVGGTSEIPFDTRIIAATNRDIESLVASGRFREDLYYRVNVVHVALPPLRARANDVLALAQQFITRYAEPMGKRVAGFSPAVGERLLAYSWPGNVRELQNCIERAIALARFEELTVEDLPPKVRDYKPSFVVVATEDPTDLVTMEEVEQRYIQRVMEAVGQNKTQAAKVLGFDRTTLYRKLERYRIGNANAATGSTGSASSPNTVAAPVVASAKD
ncbi:Response regulator of zinc sigma-54-dependent two-component system [Labilithrix luteola]|uniref:Response regulator of zinc sigma-54-dependent two-component system n=1 Tax=Labilithrix luteola TaxID=1391654 RepID=A0A0K1QCH0_9BACT|nr:sigma-54 dependent transcriptional regulator [Labilithrix luteola]AKV03423.1 Response regulator of zinc sigma-54-dependent two-component system [Labilithrix luteola]